RHQRVLQQLRDRDSRDSLTGLANRDAVIDATKSADADTVVALFDLDRFTLLNDTHRHDIGNLVLLAFAQRLADAVEPGALVGRVGGDEFAVVSVGCADPDGFEHDMRRFLHTLEAVPLHVDGHQLTITACAGVAHNSLDGPTGLFQCAEMALHAAKAARPG